MKPSTTMVERAAEAIANARGMRRGAPAVIGVLQILPEKLRNEVLEDATDALDAVGAVALRRAADEALSALEAIGRQPAPNGRPWAEDGQVWKTLLALRSAITLADEGRKP